MFGYLRLMDEQDLDWVLAVEQRVHLMPWSKKGFEQALLDGVSFVISNQDHQALGYIVVQTVLDELHLLNLAVDQKFQGQGVAQMAMKAFLERFEDGPFHKILLEVRESNLAARHLYLKLGFKLDGVRRNYYQTLTGRENALLMSLVI